jgi:hypothetical protein
VLNFLLGVSGVALATVISVYFLVAKAGSSAPIDPALEPWLWVMVGVGGFLFILSLLGCCGVCLRHKGFLAVYLVAITIVFIGELVVTIILYQSGLVVSASNWVSGASGNRVPVDVGILMIASTVLTLLMVVLSCILVGSQRRTKDGFYAGRVPANNTPGQVYTGPMLNDGQQYVEFEVVQQKTLPRQNAEVEEAAANGEYLMADNGYYSPGKQPQPETMDDNMEATLPSLPRFAPSVSGSAVGNGSGAGVASSVSGFSLRSSSAAVEYGDDDAPTVVPDIPEEPRLYGHRESSTGSNHDSNQDSTTFMNMPKHL